MTKKSIQIKMLKDYDGKLKNYIYTVTEDTAKKLVEHNCVIKYERDDNNKFIPVGIYGGTGDIAIYYSKDRDNLDGTLAPIMNIPSQLNNCRLLQVGDEKSPFTQAWQKSNNTINNSGFKQYIQTYEKYGILCGWDSTNEHFLVVIDFDDEITQREVLENGVLPETFTCKTARKGLYHLYFYTTEETKKWKILNKDKETLADIQGTSTQVIGPGSRIPDGRCYEVVKDIPIATIDAALLHKALDQFNHQKIEEVLEETGLTLKDFQKEFGPDKALDDVRNQLKITDILRENSISTSRNPTKCPFHNSKGGKCFGFDNSKGIWNCFHCGEKGTQIDLWMKLNNVTEFSEAKKKLCEKFSIEDNYVAPPPPTPNMDPKLPMVQLPQDHRTVGDMAKDLAKYFFECDELFYKVDEQIPIEVTEYFDVQIKQQIVGFKAVTAGRLFNIIESKVNTFTMTRVKKQDVMIRKSANEQTIKLLSTNSTFLNCLNKVKRLLNYPMPFIDEAGLVVIPCKGYDKRYQAFFTPNTPELYLMSESDAKNVLNDVISEFCFRNNLDHDMAIAYIITPMCRGLYNMSNARTPLFIIQANRERAGKDYLAGVVGIIYEGRAIDDTPFVTGDRDSNNEELRKKITSALKSGRRRMHSSNNRGMLDSAVLEQFLTSEIWQDRQLGGNTNLELTNEADVSLSANIGLKYTPDIFFRARPINLFYGEENPNDRVYIRTDLHGYVRSHRAKILSAIYSLIKSWVDAGQPKSSIPFTSFPEWSRVVGGIMQYHGFLNPCVLIDDEDIGGDDETKSMKELYRFMAEYSHNNQDKVKRGFTVNDIRIIIMEAQSSEEFSGFAEWNLSDKSFQIKLGKLIRRYVGRSFNCKSKILQDNTHVELVILKEDTKQSTRTSFQFKADKPILKQPIINATYDEIPKYPEERIEDEDYKPKIKDPSFEMNLSLRARLANIFADNGDKMMPIDILITKYDIPESFIEMLKFEGMLFYPKPGFAQRL